MGNSNKIDKKINNFTIKIILVIVMFLLLIAGGTYAFWTWTSNVNKNVVFSTADIEDYVIYNEGNSYFVGNFQPTDTFCESVNTTMSFYKKSEAKRLKLLASFKMDINSIGKNISLSDDVYWIVTSGNNEIECSNGLDSDNVLAYGTFNGVSAGETISMLDNIEIKLTEEFYTVWIWINSNGSDLSSLSGETIDTNVWTEISMDEMSNKIEIAFDLNGGSYESVLLEEYSEPGEYTYVVPSDGEYKLELWGAQGGNYSSSYVGGYGGYTSGKINLIKDEKLYFYVGGTTSSYSAGYNGGGIGGTVTSDGIYPGGGGATDVRLMNGEWSDFDSLKSRIMVAAGGAGTGLYFNVINGGNAGGLIGYTGYGTGGGSAHIIATAGTQVSGGLGVGNALDASFGYCRTDSFGYGTGGGSGYYGGGSGGATNSYVSSGAGGSSFISGHNGCDAISSDSTSDNIIHTGQSIHYSGKIFYDTVMIDGSGYEWTNEIGGLTEMPNLSGGYYSSGVGHSGNGAVKITFFGIKLKKFTFGQIYGELPIPVKEDYIFSGWNTKIDGSGIFITSNTVVSEDIGDTLYAMWEKIPKYTISYDANGGTGVPDSQIKKHGESLILSDVKPSKDGYVFAGWGLSSSDISPIYQSGGEYTSNGEIILYAVWREINSGDIITSYVCGDTTVGDDPYFTYTGNCVVNDDGGGNWHINFLTNGDFIPNIDMTVDAFLVGGGGGGGSNPTIDGYTGGSGGPGYQTTGYDIFLTKGGTYEIKIGSGGGTNYASNGSAGGTTTAFSLTAFGGSGGGGGTGFKPFNQGAGGEEVYAFSDELYGVYSKRGQYTITPNTGNSGGGSNGNNPAWQAGSSGIVIIKNSIEQDFYYTGSYEYINDGDDNWHIRFLTDGIFTPNIDMTVDAFLVGGGGGGGSNTTVDGYTGGSGGPGYQTTGYNISLIKGETYEIKIGLGGSSGYASNGSAGGITTAFSLTAFGGAGGEGGTGWSTPFNQGAGGEEVYAFSDELYGVYSKRGQIVVTPNTGNSGTGDNGNYRHWQNGSSGIVIIKNSIEQDFYYTGSYEYINDGDDNWHIRFLTDGIFTPNVDMTVDAFLVGGGGGGGSNPTIDGYTGGSGGPGYQTTGYDISLIKGGTYEIKIGSGGGTNYAWNGSDGGTTTAFSLTAFGGSGGGGGTGFSPFYDGTGGEEVYAFSDELYGVYSKKGQYTVTLNTGNSGGGSNGNNPAWQAGSSGIVIIRKAK